MSSGYRFETAPVSANALPAISTLLRLVYSHASYLTERYLAWQYRGNPDGTALAANAVSDGELVGHVAGMPLRASLERSESRGLFFLNAAVHPQHIRRGIMSGITQKLVQEAERRGYDFCIGMGNALSTRLFLRDFDMTPAFLKVAQLDARLGFGRPKHRPWKTEKSFERLWSEDALRWRLANPERLYSLRRNGASLAISAPTGRAGIAALIGEVEDGGALEAGGTASALKVWLGLDPSIDWRRSAYVSIPQMLRPSPLNFVYKPFAGAPPRLDPARTLLRAMDFDPF